MKTGCVSKSGGRIFFRRARRRGCDTAIGAMRGLYLASTDGAGAAATCFLDDSGTRSIVWQCWHLTSLPRTSSDTLSSRRHRRLGQSSWTGIYGLPSIIGPLANQLEIRGRGTPFGVACSCFIEGLGITGELGESKAQSRVAPVPSEAASAHPQCEKRDRADTADKVDRQYKSASNSPRGRSASKPRPA